MQVKLDVPPLRIQELNDARPREDGKYVLYWMIANRRLQYNFALQRSIWWANQLKVPLVIFEPLRAGYKWASDRFHSFIIEGMKEKQEILSPSNICYFPFLEDSDDSKCVLLEDLANDAAVIITDYFPSFFLPRMVNSAAKKLKVKLEQVDSNGILPLRATEKIFPSAYIFRRFLQKNLVEHLNQFPLKSPLKELRSKTPVGFPKPVAEQLNRVRRKLDSFPNSLREFPIDHSIGAIENHGGSSRGRKLLNAFMKDKIQHYGTLRNHPDAEMESGLSAYLHFGHISAHEVVATVLNAQQWSVEKLADNASGKRTGWWGIDEASQEFLDQIITWRELGFNFSSHADNYDKYDSLPQWARETLEQHSSDVREYRYSYDEFEHAKTHDALWNAAQNQLVIEGRIHNYLRMIWGKKILEWSATPWEALEVMIELNNKYALDGRNPNSYSGIFWILGRYDRPWGPERNIFGKIRYMSCTNTMKKLKLRNYLAKFGAISKNELNELPLFSTKDRAK